jgi:pimeloyl-ACP methyl ester carboxylesterase
VRLTNGRHQVALTTLREGPGETLLCLHALRGRAADFAELAPVWPGRVLALDFSGHGASDRLRGAGYSPELLAADADAVLAYAGGEVYVVGVGLGAWVALLLAGARPQRVAGAYLLPGAGLEGGGAVPRTQLDADALAREAVLLLSAAVQRDAPACDPMVRLLDTDARPPEYARSFADAARRLLLAEDGGPLPAWWEAARESPTAVRAPADPRAGLAVLADGAGGGARD